MRTLKLAVFVFVQTEIAYKTYWIVVNEDSQIKTKEHIYDVMPPD